MVIFFAILGFQIVNQLGVKDDAYYRLECYIFSELSAVLIALVTLFAARHIHVNSKQIERLGIRTNSTIMKLYVILVISLALCSASSITLTIMDDNIHSKFAVKGRCNAI